MKQIKLQKIFKIILIVFLIIQPLFDLKIFYNSISTLTRVIIIGILFLYYFITSTNQKKYLLLIYPAVLCFYFVFHHINALNFHSLVPGNFNYSVLKEGLYFVKMLCPFLLLYSLFKANLGNKNIFFIIKCLVLIISLIIIISNICLFSYGSYSDAPIKANLFSWFSNDGNYTYQDLASKGLFEYANQISAILIMFLPFTLFVVFKEKTFINIFIVFSNILALLLLATKVSVFGVGIVMFYTLCIFIFINVFINKNKLNFKFGKNKLLALCLALFYSILFSFNPTLSRITESKIVSARVAELNENTETYDESKSTLGNRSMPLVEESTKDSEMYSDPKTKFIKENYEKNELNELFILERYPYNYDSEFWYNIVISDNPYKMHYRFLEEAIAKRVVEINSNCYDKWFGITNTRLQNIFNIEKDFTVQYYALRNNWINPCIYPIFCNNNLVYIYNFQMQTKKSANN